MVNFDEVQHENQYFRKKNGELKQKLEQLQNENNSLRGQLQYYQHLTSSIGAVCDPVLLPLKEKS